MTETRAELVERLIPKEISSGRDCRVRAEALILQLPEGHSRNHWLLNYGTSPEAREIQDRNFGKKA